MAQLSALIESHVDALTASSPAPGSEDAYLLHYLKELLHNAKSSHSAKEVRNAVSALTRFSIDSLDLDGPAGKRVLEIAKLHDTLLRAERRNG